MYTTKDLSVHIEDVTKEQSNDALLYDGRMTSLRRRSNQSNVMEFRFVPPVTNWRHLMHVLLGMSLVTFLNITSSTFTMDRISMLHHTEIAKDVVPDSYGKTYSVGERLVEVPNFEHGGIMIYYHIYKTGGSTAAGIMSDLAKAYQGEERFFFRRIRKQIDWDKHCVPAIHMADRNNMIVMYEMHVEFPAPNYPTLVQLAPLIDRWRVAAEKRNVPFFAFTTIREPVSHALSFFNFFHVAGTEQVWNPFRGFLKPTEKNFLTTFLGNRQCLMFDSDVESTIFSPKIGSRFPGRVSAHRRHRFVPDDYNEKSFHKQCRVNLVWDALFGTLDWVGITDDLQNSTLPLMTTILLNDTQAGRNWTSRKVFTEREKTKYYTPLAMSNLSTSTLSRLYQETEDDRFLYEEARTLYHFS
jgi:hypothetical protein